MARITYGNDMYDFAENWVKDCFDEVSDLEPDTQEARNEILALSHELATSLQSVVEDFFEDKRQMLKEAREKIVKPAPLDPPNEEMDL